MKEMDKASISSLTNIFKSRTQVGDNPSTNGAQPAAASGPAAGINAANASGAIGNADGAAAMTPATTSGAAAATEEKEKSAENKYVGRTSMQV